MFRYLTKSVRNTSILAAAFLFCSACVYRLDIQQGNLLDDSQIEQVEVGMSRSQVQFLLGTPMVNDSFNQSRWDYTYYHLSPDSSRDDVERRWFIVFFQENNVVRLERDAILTPASPGSRRQEPGAFSRVFSRLRRTEEATVPESPELPAAQESPAPVDTQTVTQEPGVFSRVFSRLRRTEEATVPESLELPAVQESSAPVSTQTVLLDENRNPPTSQAAQIESNVELSANPVVGSPAREVESDLPSDPQRLVEIESGNTSTGEGWVVQLGSFSEEENARRLADRATTFGFTTRVSTYTTSSGLMFRVRVGPGLSRDRAMDIASSLSANGFVAQVVAQD